MRQKSSEIRYLENCCLSCRKLGVIISLWTNLIAGYLSVIQAKPARFTKCCSGRWSQSHEIIHCTDFNWRTAVLGPSLLCERTHWAVQLRPLQRSLGTGSSTCSWWNFTCLTNTQSWYWNSGFLSLLWFETLALISQQLTLIVQDNKQQHRGKVPEYNSL